MNYATLRVIAAMPSYFHDPSGDEAVCRRLSGAKIIKFGSTSDEGIEGGGLILDYEVDGKAHRLVFGFSELGMWVVYDDFGEYHSG